MGKKNIKEFRQIIEERYSLAPTGCGGGFDEILCYELHTQPVNPRMDCKTFSGGYETGLTFKDLAKKWGINVSFLGDIIADHCRKLEE